jgi:hypothetical protein
MHRLGFGLAAAILLSGLAGPAHAEEELCGYFAFAGAYGSERTARREARRLDIDFYDLDESDSPNAGEGYYVVASGPFDSGAEARREARRLNREPGVDGAYAKELCFYLQE